MRGLSTLTNFTAFLEQRGRKMKLVTSGYIQRLFAVADPETILRRPNLRRFAKENGVPYYISKSVWMIDFKKFMEAIAPKEYPPCDTMPRLRNIKTSVDEYNESHEQQIDRHIIEKCMKSKKVLNIITATVG